MKDIQKILAQLEAHADMIDSEPLSDLRHLDERLQQDLAAVREHDRNLRIAVIGQMKSGKSSFLNAALFNANVLPKADTPMTAALTSIVYSKQPRAEVQFYSKQDWEGIEQRALEYEECYAREAARLRQTDSNPFAPAHVVEPTPAQIEANISFALKACAELVAKARDLGADLARHLGTTKVLGDARDATQLAAALHEYVGAGGRYTAITKMTTLYLNDERLQGLEVIDTPGFNDPVVSRGAATRAHLAKCDVIFFLSPLGQFVSSADMTVLREQLPEAGLGERTVFLVGTQRDLILRQDAEVAKVGAKLAQTKPVAERAVAQQSAMVMLLNKKMTEYARNVFDSEARSEQSDERTRRMLEELSRNPPLYISSWAWLVAQQWDHLSDDDLMHLASLSKATGGDWSADRLRALSSIPEQFALIVAQRERKQELLAGKEKALADSAHKVVRKRLEQIKAGLVERRGQIQNGSISELERLEQDAVGRFEKGKLRLEDVFDEQSTEASRKFALLKAEVRKLSLRYVQLETLRETTRQSYQVDVSIFSGLFGHTWETRSREVEMVYASVQDAIEKIERFALEGVDQLQQRIADCIDLDAFRKKLATAAISLFDTGSADFEGDLMLNGINKSLRRISIPNVQLESRDFGANIVAKFGTGRVLDDDIDGLRQAHRDAIQSVIKEVERLADAKISSIEDSLARSAKTFVTDMSKDIQVNLRKLREQRVDREHALERIADATKAADACLRLM